MARLRIEGSTGLFGPYSDFSWSTRQEVVKQIYEAYDVVFNEWLAGNYDPLESLKEAMIYDDKANDLRDVHWTLWNYYPADRSDCDEYWCPKPDDWLKYNSNMTKWPTRDYRTGQFFGARTFSMHGPSGEVEPIPVALPVALPVAIPVLQPIRQTKRRKVDLEELTPSEEFDLESVALPVEPVVRRSKRVKYARDFYYGY